MTLTAGNGGMKRCKMQQNVLPNEILHKIFMYCDSEDIRKWKKYERLDKYTFLKKKDKCPVYAVKSGNIIGLKYLVETGFPIEDDYLLCAARRGNIGIVKFCVESGVKTLDVALINACIYGKIKVVKYLHEMGANVSVKALLGAAGSGYLDVVKYLVTAGADIHADNDEALKRAAELGNLEVVKYLCELGANINASDYNALVSAFRYNQTGVVSYLLSKCGDHSMIDTIKIALQFSSLRIVWKPEGNGSVPVAVFE